jgi:TolB-like protein
MKKIIALFLLTVLGACAATGPTYQDAESSDFIRTNYSAVDKLVASPSIPIDRNIPVLIATVVSIDFMNQSSRFGRLLSEQIATRMTQLGFNVVEMKLRNNVYIREGAGELLLSRDVRDLSKNYNAQVVVVGNYAVASGFIYLTLKIVAVTDNRVLGAVNYVLPLTANNQALLAAPRE